ncbi:hypothetical protein ACWDRZ_15715 [Streptomyces sp. NPDC003509]
MVLALVQGWKRQHCQQKSLSCGDEALTAVSARQQLSAEREALLTTADVC